jgi:hypothetical protein
VTAKTWLLGDDKENRNAFQNAMQDKFIQAIENLSGRQVRAFISDHDVGPDIEIELFRLAPDSSDPGEWPGSTEVSVGGVDG